MFKKIGNFAVKQRIWIILCWVLAAVLLFFFAPSLSQVSSMSESTFLPQDSESLRSRELIAKYFPQTESASTVSLVFYKSQKLGESDLQYAQQVRDC
jgi:RND superfamily putative drug exporter